MSRDLRFSAWVIDKNCYMEVVSIEFSTNKVILKGNWNKANNEPTMKAVPLDKVILEQDTGLKDKNGREIYEGDIMEFGIAGTENRGVVGYEEDFGSYETYTSKGYIITSLFTSRGKIIGNIHENPELLEGEK